MPIDYNQPGWIPKVGKPDVLARHDRRTAKRTALQTAYDAVDARDGHVCWVSKVACTAGSMDPKRRLEHHHLKGRRVKPEWREDPDRIITVSKFVHDLITGSAITYDECDARKPIAFRWNRRIVKKGREPARYDGVSG